ncbi:hypothetical protein [Cellulosilyticum sp. I15G10I2]|uniref:hypothetical protein n=1 Tax=Cellulosilyticum sp. I15G10I2 TaxID=1892843 RepID=UPI00085BC373|nr:hypothetical protein [Cellulosilyticum sp. I15G10I2]
MLSFGEHINLVLKDKIKWDYYSDTYFNGISYRELFADCRYFIESLLSNGDKLTGLAREQFNRLSDNYRLEHTVSVYFLGIILYENVYRIRSNIDSYIKRVNEKLNSSKAYRRHEVLEYECDTPFSYFWFLICFYHDYGYSFEERNKIEAFEDLLSELGELNFTLPRIFREISVPKVVADNIGKYIAYRYKVHNKLDHGIVGGLLFWKERKKDYYERRKKYNRDEFIDNQRLWSNRILQCIHLPIAWTIAAHNIWFINNESDDYDAYCKYGLDELIIRKPKISLENHPFLFLLSIVDTIDPVKLLMQNNHHVFTVDDLNSIMFSFGENTIQYSMTYDNEIVHSRYKNNIKDIKSWVCCDSNYQSEIFSIGI